MCSRSYEPEECQRAAQLLLHVYGRWRDGNGTVNSSGPHTHTQAHTVCPLTALLLAGMAGFMTLLVCEWSLVLHYKEWHVSPCLSLWSPGRRRQNVTEERSEEVHLSVLNISKFSFFPFISHLFLLNFLFPPTLTLLFLTSLSSNPKLLHISSSSFSLFFSCSHLLLPSPSPSSL